MIGIINDYYDFSALTKFLVKNLADTEKCSRLTCTSKAN